MKTSTLVPPRITLISEGRPSRPLFGTTLALLLLTACTVQPVQTPVPANLIPAGERQVDRVASRGMQTYECRAKPGHASRPEWVYVSSETELLDGQGQSVGTHTFPPPVWDAHDGSRFSGTIKARAPAPQAGAAPWLLISARSIGGEGRFSKITSLQRVNTEGGVVPTRRCDVTTVGAKERVALISEFILFSK
jgi:Protein of unknown function (DUF3455)